MAGQLAPHVLLRASFVPRFATWGLTSARSIATSDRTREMRPPGKVPRSSGIRLASVVTDLTGVSFRAMLEALINGEQDPEVLADLAKGSLRSRIPALVDALTVRFKEQHAFMALLHSMPRPASSTRSRTGSMRRWHPFVRPGNFLATIAEPLSKSPTSSSRKPARTWPFSKHRTGSRPASESVPAPTNHRRGRLVSAYRPRQNPTNAINKFISLGDDFTVRPTAARTYLTLVLGRRHFRLRNEAVVLAVDFRPPNPLIGAWCRLLQ